MGGKMEVIFYPQKENIEKQGLEYTEIDNGILGAYRLYRRRGTKS